jgi:biotin-dependent carboxylase-like uncharacterized protein
MSGRLTVRDPGLHTTLQDLGRFGAQRFGVPVAGALDTVALRLANAVVGNPPGMAALEILVAGPTLEIEAASVRMALGGTGATIEILEGGERRTIPPWHSVTLERGSVVRIGALPETICAYLAVEGGYEARPILGSVSTYARSRLGGFEGRPLRAGDSLPLARDSATPGVEHALATPPDPGRDQPIRLVLGPQNEMFTAHANETLLTSAYTISTSADRMGLRLDGPPLAHAGSAEIVSDGTAPGSIQVPGSGQPIVLLADRQTTGGYPKIATIISTDLPVLARRRPGDRAEFEAVDVAEALAIRTEHVRWLEGCATSIVTGRNPMVSLVELLYGENLISGVTAGAE